MAFIPSEQEIADMAATATWVAKVEGIPLEEAVLRVTKDWETRQRDDRDHEQAILARERAQQQELLTRTEVKERAQHAQMKKDRAGRSRTTLADGKKPLTTSLGDLLRAKVNK